MASVDKIVATSPNYLATSDVLQRFRDKVEVIPIGLDETSYAAPTAEKLQVLARARWAEVFLFVGTPVLQGSARAAAMRCRGRISGW